MNSTPATHSRQIPTSLKWSEVPEGLKLSEVTWPKAQLKAFAFTDGERIPVFEGRPRAYLTATLPPAAEPGATLRIKGSFRAQGCTHSACYAPQTDSVTVKIRVATPEDEPVAINESKFPAKAASP